MSRALGGEYFATSATWEALISLPMPVKKGIWGKPKWKENQNKTRECKVTAFFLVYWYRKEGKGLILNTFIDKIYVIKRVYGSLCY